MFCMKTILNIKDNCEVRKVNFENNLAIIGSLASIISVIGAIISWNKANKAKTYSKIYYTTDTKENLQTVFGKLENLQEVAYNLNSRDKRGLNESKEVKEYKDLRQKIITLINIIPSNYSAILIRLNSIKEIIDTVIQKNEIMDAQTLISFKTSLSLCIGEVKQELEKLRRNLVDLQNK